MSTLVLVHGAWHGAWSWQRLVDALAERGATALVVDLPTVGDAAATLADDVRVVQDAARAVGGPVVLVGHSYGGVVTTAAAEGLDVERLVYLTAFAPDTGESLLDQVDYGPLTWIVPAAEGLLGVQEGTEVELFYGDVDPATAEAARARLRPQAAASFGAAVPSAGWRAVPSTYVVCTEDRCIPPAAQRRWAERLQAQGRARVRELAASHSPFLSRPGEVTDLLLEG